MFFSLPSWAVVLIIFGIIGAATAAGYATGRYLREHEAKLREPFGVLQAALLGVVGLILAFGLTLAVGRYEDRRAATVTEANAIGTTYLRGQLVAEPVRTRSLELLRQYTDLALQVSREIPNSSARSPRRRWRRSGRRWRYRPRRKLLPTLEQEVEAKERRTDEQDIQGQHRSRRS